MGVSLAFHYRPSLSQLSVITRGRALGSFNQEETAVSKETVLFRMLQCISGVSGNKANCIVSHYHSVHALVEAFQSELTEKDRAEMLCVERGKRA